MQHLKMVLLTFVFSCAATLGCFSQNYKPFKVDLGLGFALPTSGGEGTKGGVAFTVEPHYRLSDQLAVGLRFEGAALAYVNSLELEDADAEVSILSSYSATGEYYLKDSGFRPFVGAGMGFFRSASVTLDESSIGNGPSTVIPSSSKFGFFPRVGFEAGHFRMACEYNVIKDGGYVALKIGAFIGGGRKKG